ncbi:MAG: OmpA family protein [Myxococcales bacterium]|nr:OmpA family protein [Myxococcales bacterium]
MGKIGSSALITVVSIGAFALAGCKATLKVGDQPPPPPVTAAPPPPPPKPAPRPVAAQPAAEKVEIPGAVVFLTGSDKLDKSSDAVLELVKKYLDSKPEITLFRIEGHTDSDGDDASNQVLSEKRALAVASWLKARGVDCKRLIAVGFGESKPIADNATEEGKAQNRRVVYYNAARKGQPIGGLPVDGGGTVAGDPCK